MKDGQEPTRHQEGGGGVVWGCIPTSGSSPTTRFRGDPRPREEGQRLVTYPVPSKSQHQAHCQVLAPDPAPTSPLVAPGPLPRVTKWRRVLGQQEQSHRPGDIKQQKFPPSWVCTQRSTSQVSAGLGPWEAGRGGLCMASPSPWCHQAPLASLSLPHLPRPPLFQPLD